MSDRLWAYAAENRFTLGIRELGSIVGSGL